MTTYSIGDTLTVMTEDKQRQLFSDYVDVLTDEIIGMDYQEVENGG